MTTIKTAVGFALLSLQSLTTPSAAAFTDEKPSVGAVNPRDQSESLLSPLKELVPPKSGEPSKTVEIPDAILKKAAEHQIDPKDIKLESGQWVGCKGDTCMLLGKAEGGSVSQTITEGKSEPFPNQTVGLIQTADGKTRIVSFTLQNGIDASVLTGIGRYERDPKNPGMVVLTLDPSFKGGSVTIGNWPTAKEEPAVVETVGDSMLRIQMNKPSDIKVVANALNELAEQKVVLVGSVPALCEPCRKLKSELENVAQRISKQAPGKVTIVVVELPSFHAGDEIFGHGAYPSVTMMGPAPRPGEAPVPSRVVPFLKGPLSEEYAERSVFYQCTGMQTAGDMAKKLNLK